ncbi:hypothetical protein DQ04_13321000 [Trypanosoma grayi]|uniref:hypothetical protein n=1 Tax=Trypanosoma grayi TaxID=71804 RepID=UPI0004F4A011|nr:hypothetical protein DQ04_13321000 [Trypanosoma grayi]KEG06566.1 hypothetical protein DQ04_13321000 [Trypanosoma grayi]
MQEVSVTVPNGAASAAPVGETKAVVPNKLLLPASVRTCPYCRRLGSAAHIVRCGKELVNCPDCGAEMEAAKLSAHAMYGCEKRHSDVTCVGCGALFPPAALREHLKNECKADQFRCAACSQVFFTAGEYVTHAYATPNGCRRAPAAVHGVVGTQPTGQRPRGSSRGRSSHVGVEVKTPVQERNGNATLRSAQPHAENPRNEGSERRIDLTEEECRGRGVMRVSDGPTASPHRHPSRFTRRPVSDTTTSPLRPGRVHSEHETESIPRRESAPGKSRPTHHSLLGDHSHAANARSGAVGTGTHFHKRSKGFLKELQERREVARGARHRYHPTALPIAPRLATAELQTKRHANPQPGHNTQQAALQLAPTGGNTPRGRLMGDSNCRNETVGSSGSGARGNPTVRPKSCPPARRPSATAARKLLDCGHSNSASRTRNSVNPIVIPAPHDVGDAQGEQRSARRRNSVGAQRSSTPLGRGRLRESGGGPLPVMNRERVTMTFQQLKAEREQLGLLHKDTAARARSPPTQNAQLIEHYQRCSGRSLSHDEAEAPTPTRILTELNDAATRNKIGETDSRESTESTDVPLTSQGLSEGANVASTVLNGGDTTDSHNSR